MSEDFRRNVAIFGSTGSIGTATLDVIKHLGPPFRAWAISAHRQSKVLLEQIARHSPTQAVLTDAEAPDREAWLASNSESCKTAQRFLGGEHLVEIAQAAETDIVVAAIVGIAGLESSLAAAESGKTLALANKESLVVAGPLMMQAAKKNGAKLLPIDSEHSAIFQALAAGKSMNEVARIVLTASGGSLRDCPLKALENATVEQALSHPTWKMGRKITIDSATMMNKALEIIEARWLFDIEPDRIGVVIHTQSVIHSMVEFIDGSVVAQLSPPDMRLPIQYALTYPDRLDSPTRRIDWSSPMSLDWSAADPERYPALALGFEVARAGGTAGAVLNGANEAAVQMFLDGQIRFTDITKACRCVLEAHTLDASPTMTDLIRLDRWSRDEVTRWKKIAC